MSEKTNYLGLPDDIARLAIQRFMSCDSKWRAHSVRARKWQNAAIWLGAISSISASVAAISYVQENSLLAIILSIAVAIFVPLQNTLGASGQAKIHIDAAVKFELLANDYERFIQLDLGPPMWRQKFDNLNQLRVQINLLDDRLSSITASFPRVKFKENDLTSTEKRGKFLVEYLQMKNVVVPEREIWVH